jgi:hypothetical protein
MHNLYYKHKPSQNNIFRLRKHYMRGQPILGLSSLYIRFCDTAKVNWDTAKCFGQTSVNLVNIRTIRGTNESRFFRSCITDQSIATSEEARSTGTRGQQTFRTTVNFNLLQKSALQCYYC